METLGSQNLSQGGTTPHQGVERKKRKASKKEKTGGNRKEEIALYSPRALSTTEEINGDDYQKRGEAESSGQGGKRREVGGKYGRGFKVPCQFYPLKLIKGHRRETRGNTRIKDQYEKVKIGDREEETYFLHHKRWPQPLLTEGHVVCVGGDRGKGGEVSGNQGTH